MFSEVVNALYITYLATEYNFNTNGNNNNDDAKKARKKNKVTNGHIINNDYTTTNTSQMMTTTYLHDNTQKHRIIIITSIVILWNIFDTISGFGLILHLIFDTILFYHIPRIIFVISSYIITLYYDCYFTTKRILLLQQQHIDKTDDAMDQWIASLSKIMSWKNFIPRIVHYFLRILPIYPIMAILISFLFLFIISLFELLHISTDIFNIPIYYGTLYGPFSYIYYHVKYDIIIEQQKRYYNHMNHHMSFVSYCSDQNVRHTSTIPIMKMESSIC